MDGLTNNDRRDIQSGPIPRGFLVLRGRAEHRAERKAEFPMAIYGFEL
jgi:hypothetical protein